MPTTLISRQGQDVYDLTLLGCGQIDNLFDVMLLNPSLKLDSDPPPGTSVIVKDGIKNNQTVVSYYQTNKFVPNNKGKVFVPVNLQGENLIDIMSENNHNIIAESNVGGGLGIQDEGGHVLQNENGNAIQGG